MQDAKTGAMLFLASTLNRSPMTCCLYNLDGVVADGGYIGALVVASDGKAWLAGAATRMSLFRSRGYLSAKIQCFSIS